MRGADFSHSARWRLPFRAVNQRGKAGYQEGMQRHHLLPLQLRKRKTFSSLLIDLGHDAVGFDDFRFNGLLLPTDDKAAIYWGLPLHRGPHRVYNEVVADRVGQIEAGWSARRLVRPVAARNEAQMRLRLLQRALRRRLLEPGHKAILLNRNDPLGTGLDFTELDAMADALWAATEMQNCS